MAPRIPSRVNSEVLRKYAASDEPFYVIKMSHVGDASPYEHQDDHGRVYIFKWEVKEGGHILRVPQSVWEARGSQFAHQLMEQRKQQNPLVFVRAEFQSQGGEMVTRLVHTQETAGSSPVPATKVITDADIATIVAATSPGSLAPSSLVVEEDEPVAPAEESEEGPFLHDGIAVLVKDKAYRVPELATSLDATEDDVRAAIAYEGSGLHIASGGWVKIKSA